MTPLVSVLLPTFNSAATLPWAIASLIAQTYQEWECILVDDGSADHPEAVLRQFSDPRIHYFRLDRNGGRGAARSVAMAKARGKYIGMVDADDWIYPCKLSRQVELMEQDRDLVLVSTAMAIADADNRVIGVRCRVRGEHPSMFSGSGGRPVLPEISFAASLIKSAAARRTGFNSSLVAAEDMDFLMRLLRGQRYAVLPVVTYAYRESLTRRRVLRDHGFVRSVHRQHAAQYPVRSCAGIFNSLAKSAMYQAGFALGLGDWLKQRRSAKPEPAEVQEFYRAKQVVESFLAAPGNVKRAVDSVPGPGPASTELFQAV